MGVDAKMFVRVKRPITDSEIKQVAWELTGAFGHDLFYFPNENTQSLQRITIYEQDGPDISPEEGETFIEVNLMCRVYVIGYERGPLCDILAIASWLTFRLESEVWYGGDSSGVCARKLDATYGAELWSHFVARGRRDYLEGFNSVIKAPTCPRCEQPMYSNGGGGAEVFWYCYGCPNKMITNPSRSILWDDDTLAIEKVNEFRKQSE